MILRVKNLFKREAKVLENFLSLGFINILNSSFHLIVYPILIRRVGAEAYGSYVVALSIISYFTTLITFGLDQIGTRHISICEADSEPENRISNKSNITSTILSSRFYILLLSLSIFVALLSLSPDIKQQKTLLLYSFFMVIGTAVMPGWYYIAVQKVRIYLYIQLFTKGLLLLSIILFVKGPQEIALYALFTSLNTILFSMASLLYIKKVEGLQLTLVPLSRCWGTLKASTPLFLSNMTITLKSSGLNLVIGYLFGMTSLTAYDFSMKIIVSISGLLKSLNTALFPSFSAEYTTKKAHKTLHIELILGLAVMLLLMLSGRAIIWVMGLKDIEHIVSPVFITMTILVPLWLLASFFIDLVLTANGKNSDVFYNQIVSLITIAIGSIIALLLKVSVLHFSIIVVISGVVELLYLYYISHKKSLY